MTVGDRVIDPAASEGAPPAGALGGANAELGSDYRASVGALLAGAVIRGNALCDLGGALPDAAGVTLSAESDHPVDDLVIELQSGGRVFIQAKWRIKCVRGVYQPLGKAMGQFARAIAAGLREDDRLVLSYAERDERTALLEGVLENRRLPVPPSFTGKQLEALARLRAVAAQHVDAAVVDALLDRLHLWHINPLRLDEALPTLQLEGHVCAVGAGRAATARLAATVRELARRRGGMNAERLVTELVRGRVPLADAVTAAPVVVQTTALGRLRARAIQKGTTLELFGAPPRLASLPLRDIDAGIDVTRPEDDRETGRDLALSARRRGRVLLVGQAGAGKSTAVRSLAAYCARRDGDPVPIIVHAQRLARWAGGLTDGIIELASEHVIDAEERGALRQALRRHLAEDDCLVIIDGLDEVRANRTGLVARVRDWFDDIGPAVEVIVTTRPSALRDAQQLRLPALTLQPPRHAAQTVSAILEAATPADEADPNAWREERRNWVRAAQSRDPSLKSTPLTVVGLALVAADADNADALPSTRAGVLLRMAENVISNWDLHRLERGEAGVASLRGDDAREALAIAYRSLSTLAVADHPPDETAVRRALTDLMGAEFALSPGAARAAAKAALRFWTETGLFDVDDGRLAARLRPIAEAGHASDLALRADAGDDTWFPTLRASPEPWASLELAAGLSPAAARTWMRYAARDGDAADVVSIANASRDGARFEPGDLDRLAEGARQRLLNDSQQAERVACALVTLIQDPVARATLRPHLSAGAAPDRRDVIEAFAAVRWDEQGPEADQTLRRLVANQPLARRSDDEEYDSAPAPRPTQLRAVEEAMLRLAANGRSDAELVASRYQPRSLEFDHALETALKAAGHDDLAEEITREWREMRERQRDRWLSRDFEARKRFLLEAITAVGSPCAVTPLQARRMDEIADLTETANLDWVHSPSDDRRAVIVRGWISAIAQIGGFDLGVLAAQARMLLDDLDAGDDTEAIISDGGTSRETSHWSRPKDPADVLRQIIAAVGVIPYQAAREMRLAIASAPSDLGARDLLEADLERVRFWAETLAAELVVLATPAPEQVAATDRLATHPSARRREAAAWVRSLTRSPRLFESLHDADEGVRVAAMAFLGRDEIDDALAQVLRELRGAPRQPWTCRWCGHDNPPVHSCTGCRTVGPELDRRVTELLGDGKPASLSALSWMRELLHEESGLKLRL